MATPVNKSSNEYQALLQTLARDLAPIIETAAKDAVEASGGPVAAVIADPVIDAVDAWVMRLIGTPIPVNAVLASTEPADRLSALEQHVAALTVATGHGTSASMPAVKQVVAAQAASDAKTAAKNPSLMTDVVVEN